MSLPLTNIKIKRGAAEKRLTQKEKASFILSDNLREILVGLLLGDLHGRFRCGKTSFCFKQGIIHDEYIYHLYEIFKKYCPSVPKIAQSLPDSRTGEKYTSIYFYTYTLPCFNELYHSFYISRVKVIPENIGDLFTPVSLAYWIADDGCWNKIGRYVSLSAESFTLKEVEFLIKVLNNKFNLNCYKCKNGTAYKIIIPSYSVSALQKLVSLQIPPMFRHKIGL